MLEVADEIVFVVFRKDLIPRLTQNSLPFSLSEMACERSKNFASKYEIVVAGACGLIYLIRSPASEIVVVWQILIPQTFSDMLECQIARVVCHW